LPISKCGPEHLPLSRTGIRLDWAGDPGTPGRSWKRPDRHHAVRHKGCDWPIRADAHHRVPLLGRELQEQEPRGPRAPSRVEAIDYPRSEGDPSSVIVVQS